MLSAPFYDKLLRFMLGQTIPIRQAYGTHDQAPTEQFIRMLQNPNTKRLLFDARQAAVFDDINETPPPEFLPKLHPPFDMFYLEFTEPIMVGEQEPDHTDYARAMLVRKDTGALQVGDTMVSPIYNITMFLTEHTKDSPEKPSVLGDPQVVTDRSWLVSIQDGLTFTTVKSASSSPDQSTFDWDAKPTDNFIAGAGSDSRYVGWWERAILDYSTLFFWMLAYMMAKSVTIEQEVPSRQVRRWNEKHNVIPVPWHIVKLDPKFVTYRNETETQHHHRYRYDVIGHLRFTKVRHKDNNDDGFIWKDVIEWVNPHQRGLANSLYIPKTYHVPSGRHLASGKMKQYFKNP